MDVGCEWFYSPTHLSIGASTFTNHHHHNNAINLNLINNITAQRAIESKQSIGSQQVTSQRPLIGGAQQQKQQLVQTQNTVNQTATTKTSVRATNNNKPRPSSLNINQIRLLNKQFHRNKSDKQQQQRRLSKDADLICCNANGEYDDLEAFEEEDEQSPNQVWRQQRLELAPEEFPGEEQGLLDNSSIANCSEYTDILDDNLASTNLFNFHKNRQLHNLQVKSANHNNNNLNHKADGYINDNNNNNKNYREDKNRHTTNNHKSSLQLNFLSKFLVSLDNLEYSSNNNNKHIDFNNNTNSEEEDNEQVTMATVRPISPQYQHTLDSAISLAKELASKNMADSGESSPKTPNSPDKKRFNFKLKHFSKSFSEASASIRDIESSISSDERQAYDMLIGRGPFYHGSSLSSSSSSSSCSTSSHNRSSSYTMHQHHNNHQNHHYNQDYHHHHKSSGRSRPQPFGYGSSGGGLFSMHGAGPGASATNASNTFSVKKSFFM